jgi:hypothetical protein
MRLAHLLHHPWNGKSGRGKEAFRPTKRRNEPEPPEAAEEMKREKPFWLWKMESISVRFMPGASTLGGGF